MANGNYQNDEDVIVAALHALAERNADLHAANEAIAEMEAGDTGKPLVDVANEIRAKHGWSAGG
jgi:hypothetical protein